MKVEMIHLKMVKDSIVEYIPEQNITTPSQATEWIRPLLMDSSREQIIVCGMDAKLKPTFIERVSMGGVSECQVSVAELFKAALISNAYGVMVFHNHPSGDSKPSEEDKRVTDKISKASKLLDVKFLDHIILGEDNTYYSFKESGLLY